MPHASSAPSTLSLAGLDTCINAGLLTFALHIEARVASAIGEGEGCSSWLRTRYALALTSPFNPGFYTIGPCGEEALAAVGLVLRSDDAVALHYRHLCTPPPLYPRAATRVRHATCVTQHTHASHNTHMRHTTHATAHPHAASHVTGQRLSPAALPAVTR